MSGKKLFNDQAIIVTGASGFIASCLIARLNEMGFDNIIAVDDFKSSEKWKNMVGKNVWDFVSKHELFAWMEKNASQIEAIVHLGANSSTVGTDGDEYYRTNYRYTVDLMEFAVKNEIRFVYASSAATYGDGLHGFVDDEEQLEALIPMNRYGLSKQMVDLYAKRQGLLSKVAGLKFFNVYGPNEYHKGGMASMVFHGYHQILKDGKVRLFKSNTPKYHHGDQQRDFVYVKDIVECIISLLQNELTGVYNVGLGIPNSFNALIRAVFHAMGREVNIEYIDMPESLMKSYQNYTCADMTKLRSRMNLQRTSLEEGVRDYVQNYLMHGCKIWSASQTLQTLG